MKALGDRGMSLSRDIHDGFRTFLKCELCISRCGQRGKVCNGAAGDEEPSASMRIACKRAHPFYQIFLYPVDRRGIKLAACVRVYGISHYVAHP